MNKLFRVAIATSLLISGNAFSAQESFRVQASLSQDGRISVQTQSRGPELKQLEQSDSLKHKIINAIFDIENNTLTFNPVGNIAQIIKEHYEQTDERFSFLKRYWKRARHDNLIALVNELASRDTKTIQGLLSQEEVTIDLTNPTDNDDISEFVTWYATLLDLVDLINSELNIEINLQDIPRTSSATRWTKEAAYLLAPALLAGLAYVQMSYKPKPETIWYDRKDPEGDWSTVSWVEKVSPTRKFGYTAGLYGTMGAIGGLSKAWYRNLGRRTTFAQRAKAMSLEAGKGFAVGAALGTGKQLAVEAKLPEMIESNVKSAYRYFVPEKSDWFDVELFRKMTPHLLNDAKLSWGNDPGAKRDAILDQIYAFVKPYENNFDLYKKLEDLRYALRGEQFAGKQKDYKYWDIILRTIDREKATLDISRSR